MSTKYRYHEAHVENGYISPRRVWAPTWTHHAAYQEYGTPDTLPTSEPGSANYYFTVTNGMLPEVDSDDGTWVLNAQTQGTLKLGAAQCLYFKNDGGAGNVYIKYYHKYNAGATDYYATSGYSTINASYYFRMMFTSAVGSASPYLNGYGMVPDDLVGAKIWTDTGNTFKLYHHAVIVGVGTWHTSSMNVGWDDVYVDGLTWTASDFKTFISLGSAWSSTSISHGNLVTAGDDSTSQSYTNWASTYFSAPVFRAYPSTTSMTNGLLMSYGYIYPNSSTNLYTSQNASQGSVTHYAPRALKSFAGAMRLRETRDI